MKWKTVKDAVGWYANFRKGPKAPKQTFKPQNRSTVRADSEDWIAIAGIIHRVSVDKGISLELLLRWATTADEGFAVDGPLSGALGELARRLEDRGYIEAKAKPVDCEDNYFVDLNSGRLLRTKRAT